MRCTLVALLALILTSPASAELNTYYSGVDRSTGKEVPATAQFSVDKDHVVMSLKGASSWRMLFIAKEKVLRVVDDAGKQYFDLAESGLTSAILTEALKALVELPPDQRKAAEQMMRQALTSVANAPPAEYVWTTKSQKVLGHDCTRVDVKQSGKKTAEYWGARSPDFKISAEEKKTMQALQPYLSSSTVTESAVGGGVRLFQWDSTTEGHPLVTRILQGDSVTVDLKIESWDRKPMSKDLLKIPYGYTKSAH